MWKDLTMQQRADVISMAVKAGMRDIDSIRSFYDESVGSGREFAKGGVKITPRTTGGAGYVPPIDVTPIVDRVSNLWNYSKSYLKNKFAGTGDGTFIDLSDKNVSRIVGDTKGVKTILTNEFVERNQNTIRKKKDFVNTTDTLLGDKRIPLSKISTFYGVEDGKLKAGPLSTFNDKTTIVPNRGRNVGKIKKILMASPDIDRRNSEIVDSITTEYNKEHNYKQGVLYDIVNTIFPWTDPLPPRAVLSRNVGPKKAIQIINDISTIDWGKNINKAITEHGDTINLPNLNATPKTMFADEEGNAAFISNIRNPRNIEKLNDFLSKHPSYPVMVDNGRYASYMDVLPNAEIYGGLNRPDDMFIIGTIEGDKYKDGGSQSTKAFGGYLTIKRK